MTPNRVRAGLRRQGLARAQRDDREHRGRRGQQGEGHRRDVVLDRLAGRGVVGGTGHRPGRGRRCHHRGGRRWGGRLDDPGWRGRRFRRGRFGSDGLRYGFRRRLGRWRRRGLRGRDGYGRRGRRRGRSGFGRRSRLRRGSRLRGARRGRRRAVVPAVVAAPVPSPVPSSVVAVVVMAVVAAVMSATRAVSAAAAGGHCDHRDGGRAVVGVGRRVSAAISHGRRDGQGRPQQDRDRQQAPGTGSVHPGSMGPRTPAHARVRHGSPERVEW